MEKILITGSSGFIGMHLSLSLLNDGYDIFGVDDMNDYYDPSLKNARLKKLMNHDNFKFIKGNIADSNFIKSTFDKCKPDKVVNLAAQAGVRYSLSNPEVYIDSNICGFMNILEQCRLNNIKGLVYASSSSVYGKNKEIPFSEKDNVDKPISIYAVTKKSNELMAHAYSHLYGLKTTGLRFFTVYGPWGRPDMAMYIFANKMIKNEPIPVYNQGNMMRDFTYIDDIVIGIKSAIINNYKCEIFNLGNNCVVELMEMIKILEKGLNTNAKIDFMNMQPGDVQKTFANIDYARDKLDYKPEISIIKGINKFLKWYKSYHKIKL